MYFSPYVRFVGRKWNYLGDRKLVRYRPRETERNGKTALRKIAGAARERREKTIRLNPRTHLRGNVAWKAFTVEPGSVSSGYNAGEMVALVWYMYHLRGVIMKRFAGSLWLPWLLTGIPRCFPSNLSLSLSLSVIRDFLVSPWCTFEPRRYRSRCTRRTCLLIFH